MSAECVVLKECLWDLQDDPDQSQSWSLCLSSKLCFGLCPNSEAIVEQLPREKWNKGLRDFKEDLETMKMEDEKREAV